MIKARHRETNLFKTMLLVMIKWLRNSSSLAAEPVLLTPTWYHRVGSVPGGNEKGQGSGGGQASGARRALALSFCLNNVPELWKLRPGHGQMGCVWVEVVITQSRVGGPRAWRGSQLQAFRSWLFKVAPRPSELASPGNLLEMQNLSPSPRYRIQNLCFSKILRRFIADPVTSVMPCSDLRRNMVSRNPFPIAPWPTWSQPTILFSQTSFKSSFTALTTLSFNRSQSHIVNHLGRVKHVQGQLLPTPGQWLQNLGTRFAAFLLLLLFFVICLFQKYLLIWLYQVLAAALRIFHLRCYRQNL